MTGGGSAPRTVDETLSSPGQSLAAGTRTWLETRFGHDFSGVRVHTDTRAAESARSIGARAYTVGHHVVFGAGHYAPSTSAGRRLLAHELAHVVQQRGGGIAGTIQRQDADDIPPLRPPGGLLGGPGAPPEDDDVLITRVIQTPGESCPNPPTGLGNLPPTPPCPTGVPEVEGDRFQFCTDSDVLLPTERARLHSVVSALDSRTVFAVHGYASKDAPGATREARAAYNTNLSCHRAKRVARELVNAGVTEDRIEIAAQGGSERFGPGDGNEVNRVAVVQHDTPARQTTNLPSRPTPDQLPQVVDAAKARLMRGEYALAADAYVARWSCGHFRSLAEVVERATVVIEPGVRATEEGFVSSTGVNNITLSSDIRLTDDPFECATNRIADLAFHHAARPQMHRTDDQHEAALHMLFLAGIRRCHVADPPLFAHDFDVPVATDPQGNGQPFCADEPLPGATRPQRQRANQPPPPTFTLVDLNVPPNGGSVDIDPRGRSFAIEVNPDGGMSVAATVAVAGDPREIRKYEVGVLQTVLSEDFVVSYFGGQRIRSRLPLPLRDGPRQGDSRSAPPWFDVDAHTPAQPGAVSVGMTDLPNMFLFRAFTDLDRAKFFSSQPVPGSTTTKIQRPDFNPFDQTTRPPTPPDIRNAPDRAHREFQFNTWVAARQVDPPAPRSRFSTIFIGGKRITFRIDVNFTGDALRPQGTGSWSVRTTDATAADQETMELRGATPADFAGSPPLFNEFLVSEGAPPIAQAGGISGASNLARTVEQIVRPHRRPLGLTQPLLVSIRFDMTTGRVRLDDSQLSGGVVRVAAADAAQAVPPGQASRLAREVFPELRKIVAGQIGQSQGTTSLTLNFPQPQL